MKIGKYDHIVQTMKERYDIRIKEWRKSMSGCAWRVYYHDGRVFNWVKAPFPKTPISLSIFLHEIGHHAIGFNTYKMRCEEEYQAWQWAFRAMHHYGVEPDKKVMARYDRSMRYAVGKAVRRRAKSIPASLVQFLPDQIKTI